MAKRSVKSTECSFLEAILAAPDDDAIRLVYADWLDDHGQPEYAEFIRVQVESARLMEESDRPEETVRDALRHSRFRMSKLERE